MLPVLVPSKADFSPRRKLRQPGQECLALLDAEPSQPPRLADVEFLHEPSGRHLSDSGQRLQNGQYFRTADNIVAGGHVQHVAKSEITNLEAVLQLSPLAANRGSLGQSLFALCITELWG